VAAQLKNGFEDCPAAMAAAMVAASPFRTRVLGRTWEAKRLRTPYDVEMDRELALLRLAQLLPTARRRFGVRDLAVFGSVARGEASATSDLDVLVDFEGPATFDGFMGLKFLLEDTLGVKVDLVTRAALRPRLRERVESEARRVA
jgi:predicted nucleotidyltransferase